MHFKPSGSAVLGCTLICQGKLQCRASEFTGSSVLLPSVGSLPASGLSAGRDGAPLRRKPGLLPMNGRGAWVSEEESSPRYRSGYPRQQCAVDKKCNSGYAAQRRSLCALLSKV